MKNRKVWKISVPFCRPHPRYHLPTKYIIPIYLRSTTSKNNILWATTFPLTRRLQSFFFAVHCHSYFYFYDTIYIFILGCCCAHPFRHACFFFLLSFWLFWVARWLGSWLLSHSRFVAVFAYPPFAFFVSYFIRIFGCPKTLIYDPRIFRKT